MRVLPPPLQKGDTIAIVSTARKIDLSQKKFVEETIAEWGYEVKWGKYIDESYHQFCGTDDQRASDLQDAINDPNVKAICCFRGGYGTIRVLDKVDLSPLKLDPKWVVGYSDVTALHGALNNLGVASLHGTMPVNFEGNTQDALVSLRNVLTGRENEMTIPSHALNRLGSASGELIGGNLSMIYSIAGTPYDYDFDNKILFLEDLDEYLYHIDRMMQNLKHSGKLAKLKGLIIGGMTDMNDNTVPFGINAEEIIAQAVEGYEYPVCFGFPTGHIDDNRGLVIGKECRVEVMTTAVIFNQ